MKQNKVFLSILFTAITALISNGIFGQVVKPVRYSEEMAKSVIKSNPPDQLPAKWSYDLGVTLLGIEKVWESTGDKQYYDYIQKCIDHYVDDKGTISSYKSEDENLDNILTGRLIMTLYQVTNQQKYLNAVQSLRNQLKNQPRNDQGGFWHKKIYPNQMWLDGLYMGEPFYSSYAAQFKEVSDFDDIAKQFILVESNMRDAKTGLLYHGWDASKQEKWADKTSGLSKNFWGRAMGWYAMALVDVLDNFPKDHPRYKELVQILNNLAVSIKSTQDEKSGLWWDVLNYPSREGNYEEASASCMFVYSIAKAVRLGYIPSSFLEVAKKGYAGILKRFIDKNPQNGLLELKGTVAVSGLGGKPDSYRDGSYEYYIHEKVRTNDAKGVGAFIMAASEMEMIANSANGKGKTVVLDSYYNNEYQKDRAGVEHPFHYKWEERDNGGYSLWDKAFQKYGAKTTTSFEKPDEKSLKNANVYIIVDPDDEKEVKSPNFMNTADASTIAKWVKKGGVLVLMANDSGNCDLEHLNILTNQFGFSFQNNSVNHVEGHEYEQGAIKIEKDNPIFKNCSKVYIKELSTINPGKNQIILSKDGKAIAVVARYGKGTVFAVGDPWFYNEYTDGRKLPMEFQNYQAMLDLTNWIILQIH